MRYSRLELFDAMGIKRSTIAEGFYPSGPQEFSIAVKSLAAGIYFLRLTMDGRITTEHFVVE
ncbi:MAG TPA: T9SS type A sorting domain-containing protein [Candidatus Kapabacteria bacterium]